MEDEVVIRVEGLGKKYIIGHQAKREPYVALRDVIARNVRNLRRTAMDIVHGRPIFAGDELEEIWVLKDVSFEVKRGEIVGVIGRNGAGKSTLLKILSRITEPSAGRVRIKGRVASLLEVGTGFHPELTGRENIYLNGAVLGMTREEIKRKFDEIVAFAEFEEFLDTPVKRYSSGMYMRLAFAVAAHLEPEILLVDEVLAVGDALFQEKCLGKMRDVSRTEGRTVLFVSHNMGAIQSLCGRAEVLEHGRNTFQGDAREAVRFYLSNAELRPAVHDLGNRQRTGTGQAEILSIRFQDDAGMPQSQFCMGEPINIVVTAHFITEVKNPIVGINILTDTGVLVADCRSSHYGLSFGSVKGMIEYRMRIEAVALYPRNYVVEPWLTDVACLSTFDWVHDAARFLVTSGPSFLSGVNVNADHGISFIPTSWTFSKVGRENMVSRDAECLLLPRMTP
jgi:lipopolysaccharide transport system ATP-binding protein